MRRRRWRRRGRSGLSLETILTTFARLGIRCTCREVTSGEDELEIDCSFGNVRRNQGHVHNADGLSSSALSGWGTWRRMDVFGVRVQQVLLSDSKQSIVARGANKFLLSACDKIRAPDRHAW